MRVTEWQDGLLRMGKPVSTEDEASNVSIALDLGRSSNTSKHRHVH